MSEYERTERRTPDPNVKTKAKSLSGMSLVPKYPPITTADPDIELKRSILKKLFTVSPKFVFYKLIMISVYKLL